VIGEARKLGISVLSDVPWGTHICQFYDTKRDLIDTLVPYFQAGLENNEFCIWITSLPLSKKEAEEAMKKAVPDFSRYLANQQIEIIPCTEWYLKGGTFQRKIVLNAWIDKLKQALASGYEGIRATGNVACLEKKYWRKLINYEKEINNTIGNYHLLAICNYPLHKCKPSEIIDVERNHHYNLIKHRGEFALVGGSERKQVNEKEHTILNTALDGFWTSDLEGRFLEVNDAYCQISGYTREELLKMSIQDIEAVESYEEIIQRIKKIIEQGPDHFESLHKRKDGRIIDVEVNVNYLDIEQGQFFVFIRDITELKQVEEELWESEEFSSSLLTSFPHPIIVINPDTSVRYVNPALEKLTGFSTEEIIGQKAPYPWWTPETLQSTGRDFAKAIHQGAVGLEELFQKKNGERFWVEISSTPVKHEGRLKYYRSSWIDITNRKQAEIGRVMPLRPTSGKRMIELQKRFTKEGFEGLEDEEIIELLLSLVLPARKAKKLAIACLERFKNLRDFLAASPKELQQIGITSASMFCIKLLHELPIKILKERIVARSIYKSSSDVFNYLYYSMRDLKNEIFKVIYLDNRSQIIDTVDLFEGTRDIIPIRPREIVESAIEHNAAGLIFVHNHPTGDPTPSKSDKRLTRDLVFVGNILQINVLDHIIIGADSYFSFADDGLIHKYQDDFFNLKIKGVLASATIYRQYARLPKGFHYQQ
jgi:DNA repair protein RadC